MNTKPRSFVVFLAYLFISSFAASALAASNSADLPPSGSEADTLAAGVRKNFEEKMKPADQGLTSITTEKPPQPKTDETVYFLVKKINIDCEKCPILSVAELGKITAAYEGKKINFTELRECANRIEAAYRQRGYLATASIPPQKMAQGEVLIRVVISKMGELQVAENRFFKSDTIARFWPISAGEQIQLNKARFALYELNQNPDV